MIFFFSDGLASHSTSPIAGVSYVEYMYGVCASNSAAHVSIRLNTAIILLFNLNFLIATSLLFERIANRLSEKPDIFNERIELTSSVKPLALILFST